jgi:hypothetical protein
MAKRIDPAKAKAAKQKKMAIGLSVLFVAVLAFQGPKTMKMLKGPGGAAPVAAATTPATTTDPAAPVTPTIDGVPPAGAATPTTGTDQPAVLVDSDVSPAAGEGQLTSFELFEAKDPFAPQGGVSVVTGAPATEEPGSGGAKPADGASVVPPSAGGSGSGSGSGTGSAPPPASTPPSAPTAAPATATSLSVNGTAEDVAIDGTFPKASPAFVLVSLAKDGKSVQIGVAGGTYADGAKTIKLTLGKPLTLRNTADGSQYVLLLNTVAGFVPPKQ